MATDKDDDTSIWINPIGTERRNLMHSLGFPMQDFMPKGQRFDAAKFLVDMEPDIAGVVNRPIPKEKQADHLRKLLAAPLDCKGIIGISSFPSDARARHLSHAIASAAIDQYERERQRFGIRTRPRWHSVYGNLRDSMRDAQKEDLTMLTIGNINNEASGTKIEKVRDLLEIHGDATRVVVSANSPTIDLFSFRLASRLTYAFYLGPNNLVHESK